MLPIEYHDSLRSLLHGTAANTYLDRIMELIKPAVKFDLYLDSKADGIVSRLGDLPDVPVDWTWPIGPEGPLRFMAQIQLEELVDIQASSLLPTTGVLSFFFGPQLYGASSRNDYRIARAFYFDDYNLVRATPPIGTRIQPAYDLVPAEHWDMPTDKHHLDTESFYLSIPQNDRETVACDLIFPGSSSGAMQLLGYPSREQNGFLQLECEAYTQGYDYRTKLTAEKDLREKAREWELLVQFYLDWPGIWPDGNDGYLHFWIRKDDLANRDFSRICYTWEVS